MPNKLEVMMDQILKKKFNKRIHSGYDPEDVDQFFDGVITYLEKSNLTTIELANEINSLKDEISKLKEQMQKKNDVIATQNEQLDYYKKNGYDNARVSSEVSHLREELAGLKTAKK
ncbi:MAG: DivIVA domain-containing protein [Mycoplasmataceae bacterium]|jgi:DivIVA domain-containing protein|nr:DivIVA domain-containing protein [Mycoplasmataceae bacterium]